MGTPATWAASLGFPGKACLSGQSASAAPVSEHRAPNRADVQLQRPEPELLLAALSFQSPGRRVGRKAAPR
jgi:hypothetical protein